MDDDTYHVLRNIQMNLKDYQDCHHREELEHKIKMTLMLIGALLKEAGRETP